MQAARRPLADPAEWLRVLVVPDDAEVEPDAWVLPLRITSARLTLQRTSPMGAPRAAMAVAVVELGAWQPVRSVQMSPGWWWW